MTGVAAETVLGGSSKKSLGRRRFGPKPLTRDASTDVLVNGVEDIVPNGNEVFGVNARACGLRVGCSCVDEALSALLISGVKENSAEGGNDLPGIEEGNPGGTA